MSSSTFELAQTLANHPRQTIHHLASSSACKVLVCSAILWLSLFAAFKQLLWRDPHAAFFSENGVYDLDYSSYRRSEAHEYIDRARLGDHNSEGEAARSPPVICAAITTFNRNGRQYLNETIGSMLAGLTDEERSVLHVRLLFAHSDSTVHPDWNNKWPNTVDHWGSYNVSVEEFGYIQELETAENYYTKGVYDYIYVLKECLPQTDAPYIAVFEDDIIFADGWLVKTLDSLAELRQEARSWLYLRLFYTETSLGWQASEDFWYGHQFLTFALAMGVVTLLLLLSRRICRSLNRRLDTWTMVVLVLVTAPAFTALVFMTGKYNISPLRGLERMDKYGCCTQALVFPRFQAQGLIDFLDARGSGQTDSLVEEYADEQSYERYALAPQVVQHVGLVSSRNNLPINTQSTWAFWFETQDPTRLEEEHKKLARSSIWRAIGDGS